MTLPKSAIPLLVAGMLATGISNSLFSKYQDMQCVANCTDPNPAKHVEFSQPVWQTLQMFLGECLCLLPVYARYIYQASAAWRAKRAGYSNLSTASQADVSTAGNGAGPLPRADEETQTDAVPPAAPGDEGWTGEDLSGKAIALFFAPALCDICGTTLMNVGLLFTPVSIYQMTRGALVLWVGVFSVIFLRRHLYLFQWLSLLTVMLGVCVVGISGTLLAPTTGEKAVQDANASVLSVARRSIGATLGGNKGGGDDELPEAAKALLGVLLILFAQLFTASQFVLEEKIMGRYSVEPLLAVGYEGLFGFVTTLTVQVILHFTYGRTPDGRGGYFDMVTGWHQMLSSSTVLWSSLAIALSIALFNFFGLSVTRNVSATARSTIDTCRTLGIWVVSLLLGWEVFRPLSGGLQCLGFLLLVYGTLCFNGIIKPPKFVRPAPVKKERRPGMGRRKSSKRASRRSIRRSKSSRSQAEAEGSKTPGAQNGNGNGHASARARGEAEEDYFMSSSRGSEDFGALGESTSTLESGAGTETGTESEGMGTSRETLGSEGGARGNGSARASGNGNGNGNAGRG